MCKGKCCQMYKTTIQPSIIYNHNDDIVCRQQNDNIIGVKQKSIKKQPVPFPLYRLGNQKMYKKNSAYEIRVQEISPPQDSVPSFLVPTEQFHCRHSAMFEELANQHISQCIFTNLYDKMYQQCTFDRIKSPIHLLQSTQLEWTAAVKT